jgi:TAZ zinc finger
MKHVQSKRTDWATNRVLLRSADVEEIMFKTARGDLQQYADRTTLRSRLDQALVALVVAKQASAKSDEAAAPAASPATVIAEVAAVTKPAVLEVQVKSEPVTCKPSPLNLTNDAQSYVVKSTSKSKSSSKSSETKSSSSSSSSSNSSKAPASKSSDTKSSSSSNSNSFATAQPPALTISCHHSAKQQLQQHPPRLSPSTADLTSPTACSTPSAASGEPDSKSSSSGGSALHMLQGRLLLLLHAAECTSSAEAPCTVFPKCGLAKTLLSHLAACGDQWACRTPHCTSSRHVLAHHAGCTDSTCALCSGTRLHSIVTVSSASDNRSTLCSCAPLA